MQINQDSVSFLQDSIDKFLKPLGYDYTVYYPVEEINKENEIYIVNKNHINFLNEDLTNLAENSDFIIYSEEGKFTYIEFVEVPSTFGEPTEDIEKESKPFDSLLNLFHNLIFNLINEDISNYFANKEESLMLSIETDINFNILNPVNILTGN